ncbi:SDR family oxidoreductase [Nocardia sp. alder85J]|uniref:SDR family oxidoreductase n=1 Tax=Nocardia sp. alder85J TaxID=2862949 RepID=UPI001CD78AE8|nr:SDR family oxidoreductase [Nocardia sp. alder85J]MCX4098506.1 SDR family oxidoreductase [Nocardia sp. alder85J]
MPRFEPHPDRRPVLIAGASSGIGAATAEALAELGHPVALGARRVELCEALAAKITGNGGEAFAHRLDVTDGDSVDAFVTAAEAALGPAEVVVSGAGDMTFGLIHEMTPAEFGAQIDVHLGGVHRLVHRVIPGMIARQRGDFVMISSDTANHPRPRAGAYPAAKTAVEVMARQLGMELEGTGVRVSLVRPGPTMTGMGTTTPADVLGPVLEDWVRWGFARHPEMLRASHLAGAIVAVVSAPRGAHIQLTEVQPEARVLPAGS